MDGVSTSSRSAQIIFPSWNQGLPSVALSEKSSNNIDPSPSHSSIHSDLKHVTILSSEAHPWCISIVSDYKPLRMNLPILGKQSYLFWDERFTGTTIRLKTIDELSIKFISMAQLSVQLQNTNSVVSERSYGYLSPFTPLLASDSLPIIDP